MAPPKSNVKKAQQKAARRELQQKKAAAKEQKKRQRQGQADCEETPIDVLLQQLEEEHKQRRINKTQAAPCGQPSPRAHASLTLLPSGDILLFGGECYDGKKVRVYGDLFKWDLDKSEWRHLEAPEMPKARCSHQAVYHNDALYVFGGEFSTYYQFHHFKDFWRFDLKTSLWTKVVVDSPTQVPSARSGHRMVVWRGLLILFGGFHDTGRETRYYNDLFVFSFSENKWRKIEFPVHAHVPEARGGFVFVVVGDVVFLHGGFAKVRDTHKRVQGKAFTVGPKPLVSLDRHVAPGPKTFGKRSAYTNPDLGEDKKQWHSTLPENGDDMNSWLDCVVLVQTTKFKIRMTVAPAGFVAIFAGMCATGYKSSVIVFGGVADQDNGGTNLSSTFFNDFYSFDVPKRRWYKLELRKEKKNCQKKQSVVRPQPLLGEEIGSCETESDEGQSSSGEDDNWQTTFAYFDAKGRLVKLRLEDLAGSDPGSQAGSASTTEQPYQQQSGMELLAHDQGSINSMDTSSTAIIIPACCCSCSREETERTNASEGETTTADAEVVAMAAAPSAQAAPRQQPAAVFSADVPLPRLHGMLLVRGSNLLLMGGIMELGSKEVTLDDCWSLNLNKRDRWVRLLEGTMHEHEWQGADSEAESSNGRSIDGDSDCTGSECSESDAEKDETSDSDGEGPQLGQRRCRVREEMQQLQERFGLDDPMETPFEGETLKNFFERTKSYWIQKASAAVTADSGGKHSKEVAREAFEAAAARVSAISDALRRMDELLQKQQDQSADKDF